MVNIVLGNADVSACTAGDANADGTITVEEILDAISNALSGCGSTPTPTPSPTGTPVACVGPLTGLWSLTLSKSAEVCAGQNCTMQREECVCRIGGCSVQKIPNLIILICQTGDVVLTACPGDQEFYHASHKPRGRVGILDDSLLLEGSGSVDVPYGSTSARYEISATVVAEDGRFEGTLELSTEGTAGDPLHCDPFFSMCSCNASFELRTERLSPQVCAFGRRPIGGK